MEDETRLLLGKVIINGHIECVTGLHIGASQDNFEIGGLDKPVIRDPVTQRPYIPGSSLKGKMRSMLERSTNAKLTNQMGTKQVIMRHECSNPNCAVCRLFGSAGGRENPKKEERRTIPARIIVRDSPLSNAEQLELIETGLYLTEWKWENSIDRITAAANPRQLERVPAGSLFKLQIIYSVETDQQEQVSTDLDNIINTLKLVQEDALGGHGSRGYGQVEFHIDSVTVRPTGFYTALTQEKREQEETKIKKGGLWEYGESIREILTALPNVGGSNGTENSKDDI